MKAIRSTWWQRQQQKATTTSNSTGQMRTIKIGTTIGPLIISPIKDRKSRSIRAMMMKSALPFCDSIPLYSGKSARGKRKSGAYRGESFAAFWSFYRLIIGSKALEHIYQLGHIAININSIGPPLMSIWPSPKVVFPSLADCRDLGKQNSLLGCFFHSFVYPRNLTSFPASGWSIRFHRREPVLDMAITGTFTCFLP